MPALNLRLAAQDGELVNVPSTAPQAEQTNTAIDPKFVGNFVIVPGGFFQHLFQLETRQQATYALTPTGDAMADSDALTNAKIAAAEARAETKIARLEGAITTAVATITNKLDALSGQVAEHRRDRNLIIGTIVLAALALGSLVWGAATYGDALFGRGMNVRDVVQAVIKEQQQLTAPKTPPAQTNTR